jgi:hypothetical protein
MKRSALFIFTVAILSVLVALALFGIAEMIDGPQSKYVPFDDKESIKIALQRHAEANGWQ